MNRKYNLLITAIFCTFTGGMCLLSMVMPKRQFSEAENRYLQQSPQLTPDRLTSGSYMTEAENYVSDHIAFRDQWTTLKALGERIAGKKENNGVYFADDGALIPKVDQPDPELLEKNIDYLNALAANTSVPVYFGLIPTAASVWHDKLPEGAPTADEKEWIRQLYLKTNVSTIDLYAALYGHAEEELYYHTDHHWTSLGAFYGANAIFEAMGMDPLNIDDYTCTTVSDSFYGTSYSSSGAWWVKPDSIWTYVPQDNIEVISNFTGAEENGSLYVPDWLEVKNKYAYFLGGNQPLCMIRSQSDGPRLLVIRDSYADCLAPFLSQRFSEIHMYDLRYNFSGLQSYISDHPVDAVLVLYSFSNYAKDNYQFLLAR